MAHEFQKGDKVKWHSGQGTSTGTIQKRVTEEVEIDGHTVSASKDAPRYLVKNENTGTVTGHKPETLEKIDQSKSASKSKSKENQSSSHQGDANSHHTSMSDGDRNEYIKAFKTAVNMTPNQIEHWLKTEESQSVGQTKEGDEAIGHKSGQRIVELLQKNKSDYNEDDINHMRKVVSYVKRHSAQKPSGDIEHTKWRYSLMNWGHDPMKAK